MIFIIFVARCDCVRTGFFITKRNAVLKFSSLSTLSRWFISCFGTRTQSDRTLSFAVQNSSEETLVPLATKWVSGCVGLGQAQSKLILFFSSFADVSRTNHTLALDFSVIHITHRARQRVDTSLFVITIPSRTLFSGTLGPTGFLLMFQQN